MFYVKKNFDDGSEIKVPLDDNTIYTNCMFCGKEVETNLHDMVTENFDVNDSFLFCDECSKTYHAISNAKPK
jgi:uncharacterized protein with PIN domain